MAWFWRVPKNDDGVAQKMVVWFHIVVLV